MERYNKTKAERRELIFKMDYILLMFLTEKNLLEKFIDNCRPITAYSDFNTTDILTAFSGSYLGESDIWRKADKEYFIYRNKVQTRMNKILHKE